MVVLGALLWPSRVAPSIDHNRYHECVFSVQRARHRPTAVACHSTMLVAGFPLVSDPCGGVGDEGIDAIVAALMLLDEAISRSTPVSGQSPSRRPWVGQRPSTWHSPRKGCQRRRAG